jgi:PAS domain S-box-containing protein
MSAGGGTTNDDVPTATGSERLRLLVVDDDEMDRLAVRRCLRQSGVSAKVDEARSAAETLERLSGAEYDCVLLDYYLPDMPGLSLFQRMRAVAPDVPVVMFTGRGDEDIAVELMKSGAADYLPKASMSPERLAAAVRHARELATASVARRAAEEKVRAEESRFRTLANAIPQLAWMTDPSGARHWFNDRWFEYTGTTLEEMEGWGWRKVHHPDHVDRVTHLVLRSCASGEPWEDTFPLRGKDGAFRWFLSRALPIRGASGNIVGWIGTNTDVTDQKNAEAERERLLALEHEARSKAERATKAREELLAIVAHDLRNPLQVVTSASARLASAVKDEKLVQYAHFIQRSARDMDRLVSDLLDISSMESGSFSVRRRKVALPTLLNEVCEQFDSAARERHISLLRDVDGALTLLRADGDRLKQVISNLLGNALKFTPEGGRVSVTAHERDGEAEIAVQDSGPGISPENLPRIFDRFWQGDRASRSGAGLGLAICKGIVEAHRGRIWAESTLGSGTTFYVRVPTGAGV